MSSKRMQGEEYSLICDTVCDQAATDKRSAAQAATKALHPERMRFNSRGRAALRHAHGAVKHIEDPEKVKAIYASLTLSGSAQYDSYSVGFAQSRSPTAIDFGPCGTKNSLKKHEVVCLQHR